MPDMKAHTLFLALCPLTACLLAAPARAGHYVVSYSGGGYRASAPVSNAAPADAGPQIATFIWQPAAGWTAATDPPPSTVVITVTASASCTPPAPAGEAVTDTRYSVISNPGLSFSVVCSPIAPAQAHSGPTDRDRNCFQRAS